MTRFLLELTWEGRRVIKRVLRRQEVYHGPQAGYAADLLLLSEPGFDLKGGLTRQETFAKSAFTGMHTHENAFFFCLDSQPALPPQLAIVEAGPHIMTALE